MDEATSDVDPLVNVTVKFSGRSIPLSLSADLTVKDLKSLLQPLTDVLPRGQKLIFKGKLLVDLMTLKASKVSDGSKIMLMASHGLHQGEGPITKNSPVPSNLRRAVDANQDTCIMTAEHIKKARADRWKMTGVVALSGCCLKDVPEEVWSCGSSVRVLDISNNSIEVVSDKIQTMVSLQKLLLYANQIPDGGISWECFSSLKSLTVLSLSQNRLVNLPAAIRGLTSLQQLDISNNKLTNLPDEIAFLSELQLLKASNNRLSTVPECIGCCYSLIEVDLSFNLLVELPEGIGYLRKLKVLRLSNNGLSDLPSMIFRMCSELSTLDIHRTEITIDILRQFEGWEAFDERRRMKHQKQLDFRVGNGSGFDEGADQNDAPK